MVLLYVDESGDLGYKEGSSKVFVIGYLVTTNYLRLSKDVEKLRMKLKKELDIGEFKFSKDKDNVKREVLNLIVRSDIKCGYIAVKKEAVKPELRNQSHILYNYLAIHYPLTNIINEYRPNEITYVIDRQSWKKERVNNFNSYIANKANWLATKIAIDPPRIVVKRKDSQEDRCLQITDYIAGTIFYRVTKKDNKYWNIIESRFPHHWRQCWYNK